VVAYLLNMPSGFPGVPTRVEHMTSEAQQIDAAAPPTAYGTAVVMDAATGTVRPPVAADVAGFYGLYIRPYPTQGFGVPPGSLNDPIGGGTPPVVGTANVMRRGYMICQLGGAAPAVKNAPVNVWTGAAGGGQVPGNVTAVAPAAGTVVALPNAVFMSAADANGLVEVAYNI
jgi:hypothetical protein